MLSRALPSPCALELPLPAAAPEDSNRDAAFGRRKPTSDSALPLPALDRREIKSPTPIAARDVHARATDAQGRWRGMPLLVYESDGWTIFEDLSGELCALGHEDASVCVGLAEGAELVQAEYNDAIDFASTTVVKNGAVEFEFFSDPSSPDLGRNRGVAPAGAMVATLGRRSISGGRRRRVGEFSRSPVDLRR